MKLGVLVFNDFELLDVFGPLEMLGQLKDTLRIDIVSDKKGLVKSAQGPSIHSGADFSGSDYDIIMVPGGKGTRKEIDNVELIKWIKFQASQAQYISSVCTGSALLAKAGVLSSKRATTNKLAYAWVTSQSKDTHWIAKARWVQDGNIFTSAGVSAGIDMSLALIAYIWGKDKALQIADWTEYHWVNKPDSDVFAEKYHLI